MHTIAKALLITALLATSACNAKSEAQRDYLLAHDHAWIDLTLLAPLKAETDKPCDIDLRLDGNPVLQEFALLPKADDGATPLGLRTVVPTGKSHAELVLSSCVKKSITIALELPLEKNQLASLDFDGKDLLLKDKQPYEPASIEQVKRAIKSLQAQDEEQNGAAGESLALLTKFAIATLLLNVATLLYVFWTRQRK